MKSLYESILNNSGAGLHAFAWNKTKPVIDYILNASTEFPMMYFLKENNLRLDEDVVKKIVKKLKKVLPEGAFFGSYYGIPQIAKQNVEWYGTVKFTDTRYAYYKIEISYGIEAWGPYKGGTRTEMEEFLIYLTNDYIYALDIPETKSILDSLDEHFDKYTTQDEVKLTSTYKMKSNIRGKYRIYSFKDITKEFVSK